MTKPLQKCCLLQKWSKIIHQTIYNKSKSLVHSEKTFQIISVVNNWFIIMEGHAYVTTEWSRIFFMTFYVFTMIVMTIIVAFILEAFLFRIQYKEFLTKKDGKILMTSHTVTQSVITIHWVVLFGMSWEGEARKWRHKYFDTQSLQSHYVSDM